MTDTTGFDGLGIAPTILATLRRLQFHTPTPIQSKTIPVALQGSDVIGIAQTGTGKTLAFGIPMLQRLQEKGGKGLILLPTRELAIQVDEALQKFTKSMGMRTAVLIGGDSMAKQLSMLRHDPHVVIATPGRLNDHLEQKTIRLHSVSVLILDEADRMLDMGFAPQIKKILAHVPTERQTLVFSATMPDGIAALARHEMRLPVRLEVAPSGTAAERVTQEVFFVDRDSKVALLQELLTTEKGSVLVFSRTKFGAKRLTRQVRAMGHSAEELHSNRTLNQRRFALDGFRKGKYRVLVATDIAARGIDVTDIALVVNFDLPDAAEEYVHRIGRTARAGKAGRAVSFAMPSQRKDVKDIERLIRMTLPVTKTPASATREHRVPGPVIDEPRRGAPAGRPFRGQRRGGFPEQRGGGFRPRRRR